MRRVRVIDDSLATIGDGHRKVISSLCHARAGACCQALCELEIESSQRFCLGRVRLVKHKVALIIQTLRILEEGSSRMLQRQTLRLGLFRVITLLLRQTLHVPGLFGESLRLLESVLLAGHCLGGTLAVKFSHRDLGLAPLLHKHKLLPNVSIVAQLCAQCSQPHPSCRVIIRRLVGSWPILEHSLFRACSCILHVSQCLVAVMVVYPSPVIPGTFFKLHLTLAVEHDNAKDEGRQHRCQESERTARVRDALHGVRAL
mmetsp:Transcript_54425/g.79830  ORF Transcript_54425/g.79830 Transcript_54425/m.79830 type:complete len:258 (+) Transcript_54425:1429-2202(+)